MNNQRVLTFLSVSIFIFLGFFQTANAGMVGTQQLFPAMPSLNLEQVRQDIKVQLVDLGVEQQQAEIRVAAMTDAQIAEINQKLSDIPAGGDLLGVALTVFIVLVITDVMGATDIFPFIKPVK